MSTREFDPRHLDVAAFAKAAGELSAQSSVAQFARLRDCAVRDLPEVELGQVAWQARGERRARPAGEAQVWLHLRANAAVPLQCQRCLQPVVVDLAVDHPFLFVHGEEAAALLDAESDDDVLALSRSLDLLELIEDELLLSLPLVPRHEVCPNPLPVPVQEDEAPQAPHPFAALAALKGPGELN